MSSSSDTKNIPTNKGHKSQDLWSTIYEELCENIREEDGVTILEASTVENTSRLRLWLLYQNSNFNSLNDDQKAKIQGMIDRFDKGKGLPLEVTTRKTFSRWMLRYKEMKREFEKNGKGKAISNYKRGKISLSKWVRNQKIAMRDNTLAKWQFSLLQEAGLKPASKIKRQKLNEENESRWNNNYESLKTFKEKNGHCSVPPQVDAKLSGWVKQQRHLFTKKLIRQDRKERLDKLGFCWERSHQVNFE